MAKLLAKNTFLLDLSSTHMANLYFPGSLAGKRGHRTSPHVKDVCRSDGCHFQTKVFKKWVHPLHSLFCFLPVESRLQWNTMRWYKMGPRITTWKKVTHQPQTPILDYYMKNNKYLLLLSHYIFAGLLVTATKISLINLDV